MKRFALVLALLFVPIIAQAQILPALQDFSITIGVGSAIPARWDEFTENYSPTFYRVLNAEYAVSPVVSLYGTYDRAVFASDQAPEIDVTSWGIGSLFFFDVIRGNNLRGFAKIGGTSNVVEGSTAEWSFPVGLGIDWSMSEQASLRFGGDLRTLSNSDEIESVILQVAVNIRPGRS